jgi:outer membrane protein TolC
MLFILAPRALARACLVIAVAAAPRAAGQALSLDDAIRLGEGRSTRIAAQSAAVSAASEVVDRARELPDPKLTFGIDNLPVSGPDAWQWNTDFMTMRRIGVVQDIVNGDKRKARGELAARMRELESANLDAQRAQLRQEIAIAWFEATYAERGRELSAQLVGEFATEVDTLGAAVAGGRMSAAQAIAARSQLEAAKDRVLDQERVVRRARIMLAAFLGEAADRPLGAAPDTSRLPYAGEAILKVLEQHPVLRTSRSREALATSEVALAESTTRPDWSVELSYGWRSPNFSNMVTLMFAVDLPIGKARRQDRDIASKLAMVDQARAQSEDARRVHEAEVRGLIADWETAERRVERYETALAPLARERTAAALAAYRGGRGELGPVLEARRAEIETGLARLAVELERAKAWSRLTYLTLEEHRR